MDSDIKILKLLLDNNGERFTIKKISETLKINYRIAYERVLLLETEGLIRITKAGNSKICEFTYRFNSKVYEAEYQRREDILKNKDLRTMLDYFERNLKSALYILLLFGSYAKQKQTKHSDIDLLFIVSKQDMENDINKIASLIPLKIHINVFTEQEFKAMKNSREATVGSEAIKNNIILKGIEAYYGEMR